MPGYSRTLHGIMGYDVEIHHFESTLKSTGGDQLFHLIVLFFEKSFVKKGF